MLTVTICATKSYTYAMRAQAQRVVSNILAARQGQGSVILVGDTSRELADIRAHYEAIIPDGWTVKLVARKEFVEGGENYKKSAQLLIAAMRTAAFDAARSLSPSACWSLDSDVLPPANALRCSLDSLAFDAGYYSVATCPYPNTAFLGGFGAPHHHIFEDFKPHERKLPQELKDEFVTNELELRSLREKNLPIPPESQARWEATNKKIRECPPDGTIWEVIAKYGWRRRGWLDNAYPAIGRGAMVPSDWCGFGCTLMNPEALARADFEGYDGAGTEDLFVCWHRWHPAGLRINVIPHCPCDHVIWEKKKGGDVGKFTHHVAYHEVEGEHVGHLRVRQAPWLTAAGTGK